MASESKVAVIAAFLGNLAIAILKLVAGLTAGSSALIAEAAHSFSDTGNQVLLFIGLARASRPPSEEYPYGTSKSAYLWSFLVAILLFGVAGAFSVREGWEKLHHLEPVEDIRLGLVVLAGAFVIEAGSFAVAFRQARKAAGARGIHSIREFLAENRDATLLTVLVEDALALAGLPLAAAALILAKTTGDPRWDAAGSLVIGAMLMAFSMFLAAEVHALLIGRGLSKGDVARARAALLADPAVEGILSLESMHLGPDTALLGVEVDLRVHLPAREIDAAITRIEAALKAAVPVLRFVYIEPKRLG